MDDISFSQSELDRYSRQIRIEGFGMAAQEKLKASTVMVSRVGGVGGTIAAMLARAGIGHLILVHGGKLVPEYMNRMQLATPADIGLPCTEVFVKRLSEINPDVTLTAVAQHINENNVVELVSQVDMIADGAPLFEERYLMNREAIKQNKPLVMGAMYGLEGYVTTIVPQETPCLKCIYPRKPDYWVNKEVFPAIGPGPRIVGAMAAMEVIKILTGFGKPLKNILWYFDLETNDVRQFKISKQADCPVCGQST